jgi:hypothetical protein
MGWPVIADIAALLDHHLRYVRCFAVDAVLASATAEDGAAVAAAVGLIDDPDDAVRWKALTFLAWASADQLAAGGDVLAALDDLGRLARVFAAAATVRLARLDRGPLERAAVSADPEVSTFAREQLESGRLPSG